MPRTAAGSRRRQQPAAANGGSMSGGMELEQRDSTQSLELDILQLTQRWEAQRTIRNGDTPGQALRKGAGDPQHLEMRAGWCLAAFFPAPANRHAVSHLPAGPRPALAPIPVNVAAAAPAPGAINPFSFTAQRQKTAASRCGHHHHQPAVRFAVADTETCDAERTGAAAASASAAATPAIMPPASHSKAAVAASAGGASAGSPSPYVLFRGRLSFAAEADSGAL